MRFVQKDAAEFLRQDHAAAAKLFDEVISFGISDPGNSDEFDDAASARVTNAIALLYDLARNVAEHHLEILRDAGGRIRQPDRVHREP